jgi:hypothetical protein
MDAVRISDPTLTVDEFCVVEKISKAQLYLKWKAGTGPDFYWNGTHRRISAESRERWRRKQEEEARHNGPLLAKRSGGS